MTETESLEFLERKVLRHLAIKAGRNPAYFVVPTMEGLMRATWCDDQRLIKILIANLVRKGKIVPASRTTGGQTSYGFTCLPAKLRDEHWKVVSAELKLTPCDRAFLKGCGIDPDGQDTREPVESESAAMPCEFANR
jgi:hypothetical protein